LGYNKAWISKVESGRDTKILPQGKELLMATSELFITYKLLGDSKRNLTELR
jgi:hypothetical protein